MNTGLYFPFLETMPGVGVTGTTLEISLNKIPTGKIRFYDRFGVINETTSFTRVRFLVRGLGADHLINEQNTLAANVLYWDDSPIMLGETMTLVCQCTGVTTGDKVRVFVMGREFDVDMRL